VKTMQELFAGDSSRWCQNKMANGPDWNDEVDDEFSPKACQWCLAGAAFRCYSTNGEVNQNLIYILSRIRKYLTGGISLSEWNDSPERLFDDVWQLVTELNI
jgi:hypothetical protein